MLHSKTIETIVGAFILVGLGALLVLAMRVSNLSFASMTANGSYTVTAHFDNVGGLKVRSPVKMAGVVIGRVSNIGFDSATYEAVASLAIDRRYSDIPTDTTASIYTAGLLGEQYVGLEAGGADEFLQEGDQITLTESAVVLERIIGQFLYDKGKGN
ncbi:MAG: outer membrane lipid asymmetry maintenance protein MlaD [Gammaproteobacteria bacterium]|nr:outer membrane lipid asymmetry maintenance protein MlaD [Gammaproteobacteria bacterium]